MQATGSGAAAAKGSRARPSGQEDTAAKTSKSGNSDGCAGLSLQRRRARARERSSPLSAVPAEVIGARISPFLDYADAAHLALASRGIHASVAAFIEQPFLARLLAAQTRFYRQLAPDRFEEACGQAAEAVRAIRIHQQMQRGEPQWSQVSHGRLMVFSIYVTKGWVARDRDGIQPHDSQSLQFAAALQAVTGHLEHAQQVARWNCELFPRQPLVWQGLSQVLMEQQSAVPALDRDFSGAVAAAERALVLADDEPLAQARAVETLALALMLDKQAAQALSRFASRLSLTTQAMLHHELGASAEEFSAMMNGPARTYDLVARTKEGKSPQMLELAVQLALALAKAGRSDAFFEWAVAILDTGERPYALMRLHCSPLVDAAIRSDPRWPCLMRSLCGTPRQQAEFDADVPKPRALGGR